MTVIDHAPVTEAPPEPVAERAPAVVPEFETVEAVEAVEPATATVEHDAGAVKAVTGELRHVRASAAARVVAILATVVAAAWALGVVLLWLTADALGATSRLEGLMRDVGFEGFHLASAPFFLGIALLGLVFVLACTVAALLAAAAFNAVAHLTGGVPVTVVMCGASDAPTGD